MRNANACLARLSKKCILHDRKRYPTECAITSVIRPMELERIHSWNCLSSVNTLVETQTSTCEIDWFVNQNGMACIKHVSHQSHANLLPESQIRRRLLTPSGSAAILQHCQAAFASETRPSHLRPPATPLRCCPQECLVMLAAMPQPAMRTTQRSCCVLPQSLHCRPHHHCPAST